MGTKWAYFFLEVASSPKGYLLSQCKYANEAIYHAKLTDDEVVITPIDYMPSFLPIWCSLEHLLCIESRLGVWLQLCRVPLLFMSRNLV